MNHRSSHSSIDWQELDCLVDGRLDDESYRDLLRQIDADPDGWKQCALAFLEHQALTRELSVLAIDPDCGLLPCLAEKPARPSDDRGHRLPVDARRSHGDAMTASVAGWMSMALCIVGGVALGLILNINFNDRAVPDMPLLVEGALHDVGDDSESSLIVAARKVAAGEDTLLASRNVAATATNNGEPQKGDCDRRGCCESHRYRTSLETIKEQTRHSDRVSPNLCTLFEYADRKRQVASEFPRR
jgi:hypothetical protein